MPEQLVATDGSSRLHATDDFQLTVFSSRGGGGGGGGGHFHSKVIGMPIIFFRV